MHKHAIIGMNAYPNAVCHKGINVVLRLVIVIKTTPKREIPTYIHMFINVTSLCSTKLKKKHKCSNSN